MAVREWVCHERELWVCVRDVVVVDARASPAAASGVARGLLVRRAAVIIQAALATAGMGAGRNRTRPWLAPSWVVRP